MTARAMVVASAAAADQPPPRCAAACSPAAAPRSRHSTPHACGLRRCAMTDVCRTVGVCDVWLKSFALATNLKCTCESRGARGVSPRPAGGVWGGWPLHERGASVSAVLQAFTQYYSHTVVFTSVAAAKLTQL